MTEPREFPLMALRTDGWFERVGQNIGSFDALCDVLGARFFAFALITGTQITALTIDRRNPDQTTVEFSSDTRENGDPIKERLPLRDFRRRLVQAVTVESEPGPPPRDAADIEGIQAHLGVRLLLLAPVFGYALETCIVSEGRTEVTFEHEGESGQLEIQAFRARLRQHVLDEFQRAARSGQRSSIELSRVAEAERAAKENDHAKVLELLGAWPAPLSIFLRTPEGQSLGAENRSLIARGLSLLGSALSAQGELAQGEEVLRLAIQYVPQGVVAGDAYLRLGTALVDQGRYGEAIALLRRARKLGASGTRIMPLLVRAFIDRGRWLAAAGALSDARRVGCSGPEVDAWEAEISEKLGPALARWRKMVGSSA